MEKSRTALKLSPGMSWKPNFKVLDPDEDEELLEDTLVAVHRQITEKKYEMELVSRGFAPEKIRSYGFAFRGKECLIG